MRWVLALLLSVTMAQAAPRDVVFTNIDGGEHRLSQWAGQPVLVVNTASQCGYTGQYSGLQALYDRYRARGLVVLAVPSDDFNQELGSADEVKEFCEVTFGLDLPMTDITAVRGTKAHPFYRAVKAETGFEPGWNFNKILIGPDGRVVGTWGAPVKPESAAIVGAIEPLLN
ncbi:glutathione peroxidase [Sulfitobacter alexandrii]|nr:glutathione peroxidase [Sulfitobacter alexandrii]